MGNSDNAYGGIPLRNVVNNDITNPLPANGDLLGMENWLRNMDSPLQGGLNITSPEMMQYTGLSNQILDQNELTRLLKEKDSNQFAQKMAGWGSLLQGASGIGGLYLGKKQYDLAKKSLAESSRQFDLNYGNQVTLTNAELRDRQQRRVDRNSNATPVEEYMNQNRVG